MPTTAVYSAQHLFPIRWWVCKLDYYISTSFSFYFFSFLKTFLADSLFKTASQSNAITEFLSTFETLFFSQMDFFEVLSKHPAPAFDPFLWRIKSWIFVKADPSVQYLTDKYSSNFFHRSIMTVGSTCIHMYSPFLPIQQSSLTFPQKGISNRGRGLHSQACLIDKKMSSNIFQEKNGYAAACDG